MEASSNLKDLFDLYFQPRSMMEAFTAEGSSFLVDTSEKVFPALVKTFSEGNMKGDTLMVMAVGLYVQYTFAAHEHFKEIIFATATDRGIQEIDQRLKNEPGAIDFCHAAKQVGELKGDREHWRENQCLAQSKFKQVLKYDVTNCNPLSLKIPPADCLLLPHCLECHVLDRESYYSALKNVSSLLKTGGHLIMIACLEETFYLVDNVRFPHLYFNEDFVRKALTDTGYSIEELYVFPRKLQEMHTMADYAAFIYVNACKETTV